MRTPLYQPRSSLSLTLSYADTLSRCGMRSTTIRYTGTGYKCREVLITAPQERPFISRSPVRLQYGSRTLIETGELTRVTWLHHPYGDFVSTDLTGHGRCENLHDQSHCSKPGRSSEFWAVRWAFVSRVQSSSCQEVPRSTCLPRGPCTVACFTAVIFTQRLVAVRVAEVHR